MTEMMEADDSEVPRLDDQDHEEEANRILVTSELDMTSSTASKRMSLSLMEKLQIIEELENGEKQAWIVKTRNLPKSTVQSIWKNREKITRASSTTAVNRKRLRRGVHENLEVKLVEWIATLKSQNINVTGPQLRARAQAYAKMLGISDFRSSSGWLDKFKTRHNLNFKFKLDIPISLPNKNLKLGAPPVNPEEQVGKNWVENTWPEMCGGYSPEDIFNLDEFGLYYSVIPEMIPKLMNERCQTGKLANERMTIMLCTNSTGNEKREMVVAGGFVLSGNYYEHSLPVRYVADSKAWISRYTFEEELRRWNQELEDQNRNILLLVDGSPAHESIESFSRIKIVPFPSVASSFLQPLERDIVGTVKAHYRRFMLERIIRKASTVSQQRLGQIGAKVVLSKLYYPDANTNILDAVFMLHRAWMKVAPAEIQEAFRSVNLLPKASKKTRISAASAIKASEKLERQKEYDETLVQRASKFLVVPEDFTFDYFVSVDTKLPTTDYLNDDFHSNPPQTPQVSYNVPPLVPFQSQSQIYESLEVMRKWFGPHLTSAESKIVHESISALENMIGKQGPDVIEIPALRTADPVHSTKSSNAVASSATSGIRQMQFSRLMGDSADVNNSNTVVVETTSENLETDSGAPGTGQEQQGTLLTFTLNDSDQGQSGPHMIDAQQIIAYLT